MALFSTPHASRWIYGGLTMAWLLVVGWQCVEHSRVNSLAQQTLLSRARDISNTIAVISRSSMPGFIRQSRLESALNEMCEGSELISVALLNSAGETIVAGGEPLGANTRAMLQQSVHWDTDSVMIVNPVDFGALNDDKGTTRPATIVIPAREDKNDERLGPPPPDSIMGRNDDASTDSISQPRPAFGPPGLQPPFDNPQRDRDPAEHHPAGPNDSRPASPPDPRREEWRQRREQDRERERNDDREPGSRRFFRRPPWMDQARYDELQVKRGLHGFILVLNNSVMKSELRRDAWLRVVLSSVALVAAIGLGLAWRGIGRATQLHLRLLRAQELNEHLRELNLAAAGLAHETRNPLNIVRGLAQMIARQEPVPPAIQVHARQITDEVDQVTHRLNEFIKYSRPTQPRLVPTALHTVIAEVNATLAFDREDKRILCTLDTAAMTIQADESQLRQVLFNLMLNAIQAVPAGGEIRVTCTEDGNGEAHFNVEDTGPGVSAENRDAIFQPYFTTHEEGSGLGLAVVRQIVLAHHWEIDVTQSALGGALFRVRAIKMAQVPKG